MVTYDHWSYMAIIFRIFEVMWRVPSERIRIDGVMILGKLQKINFTSLWLMDTQFSHAGTQRAAIEAKDFCSPVLAAYFPMGLLKYPDNIVTLDLIQRFFGCR